MDGHTTQQVDITNWRPIRDPRARRFAHPIGVHVAASARCRGCGHTMIFEVAPAVATAPVLTPWRDSAPRAPPLPSVR